MLLDNARVALAEALEVRPDEVIFTSSGTAAVHLGLAGLLEYADGLAAGAADHSSVLQTGAWAERRGSRLTILDVDRQARTSYAAAPPGDVLAVAPGNHEVGTLQDPPHDHDGPVFVNACAAGGRLPLPRRWDVAALSAHKWGGPPGVGVLLVRRDARWRSPWPADDRADNRSTGFENIPAALAAAAALQATTNDRDGTTAHEHGLIDRLRAGVGRLADVDLHGDPVQRLPHIAAFSCLFVNGEALVTELNTRGFAVSSGSACTASTLEPSHVLVAMGALTHGNLRVSVQPDTTESDIDAFLDALADSLLTLREGL